MKQPAFDKADESLAQKITDLALEKYRSDEKAGMIAAVSLATNEILGRRFPYERKRAISHEAYKRLGSRGGNRTAKIKAKRNQIEMFS